MKIIKKKSPPHIWLHHSNDHHQFDFLENMKYILKKTGVNVQGEFWT